MSTTGPLLDPGVVPQAASSSLRMAIFHLARRLRSQRTDSTVTDPQFSVLAYLRHNGPDTIGGIAEAQRISPPSVNRTVNVLVESGLVRREDDPDDGRRVRVVLTAKGEQLVADTQRKHDAWIASALAELDAYERAAIYAAIPVLRKLAAL